MEDWFNFGVISAESRSLQLCHGSIFFPFGISNVEYFEHPAFLLSAPFNNHLYNNLAPALFARLAAKEGNTNLSLQDQRPFFGVLSYSQNIKISMFRFSSFLT